MLKKANQSSNMITTNKNPKNGYSADSVITCSGVNVELSELKLALDRMGLKIVESKVQRIATLDNIPPSLSRSILSCRFVKQTTPDDLFFLQYSTTKLRTNFVEKYTLTVGVLDYRPILMNITVYTISGETVVLYEPVKESTLVDYESCYDWIRRYFPETPYTDLRSAANELFKEKFGAIL